MYEAEFNGHLIDAFSFVLQKSCVDLLFLCVQAHCAKLLDMYGLYFYVLGLSCGKGVRELASFVSCIIIILYYNIIHIRKRSGPKTEPCGTLWVKLFKSDA